MVSRTRNRGCVPNLSEEGVFLKPLAKENFRSDDWYEGMSPFERVNMHQTLSSARRFVGFKAYPGLVPNDDLDFILSSCYNHSEEIFPEPVDVILQPDTEDLYTGRRLRNDRIVSLDPLGDAKKSAAKERELACRNQTGAMQEKLRGQVIPYTYNFAHKVIIGGILEKKHPSNIKLMNTSHHSPQTNAGYSRQPSYGTFFQY